MSSEICCISPSLIMKQTQTWTLFHGFYFGVVLLPCCGNSPEMACLSSSALLVFFKYNPIGPWSHRSCVLDFPDVKSAHTWLSSGIPLLWLCCAFPPHSPAFPDCFHVSPFTLQHFTYLCFLRWATTYTEYVLPFFFSFWDLTFPNLSASNSEICIYSQFSWNTHTHTHSCVHASTHTQIYTHICTCTKQSHV